MAREVGVSQLPELVINKSSSVYLRIRAEVVGLREVVSRAPYSSPWGLCGMARQLISQFLCVRERLVVLQSMKDDPCACQLSITSLQSGKVEFNRRFATELLKPLKVACCGPETEEVLNTALRDQMDLVTGPWDFKVCYASDGVRNRGVSSLVGSEAFSVRALGARYPSVLLGLRWEVVLGRWSLGFFGRDEDKTVVIERCDGKAVYVRAGVGTVVNVAQGWAAVAGCRLVAIFDLTNGRELLRTTFDPRPLGKSGWVSLKSASPWQSQMGTSWFSPPMLDRCLL